jgi:hypothetical protein
MRDRFSDQDALCDSSDSTGQSQKIETRPQMQLNQTQQQLNQSQQFNQMQQLNQSQQPVGIKRHKSIRKMEILENRLKEMSTKMETFQRQLFLETSQANARFTEQMIVNVKDYINSNIDVALKERMPSICDVFFKSRDPDFPVAPNTIRVQKQMKKLRRQMQQLQKKVEDRGEKRQRTSITGPLTLALKRVSRPKVVQELSQKEAASQLDSVAVSTQDEGSGEVYTSPS